MNYNSGNAWWDFFKKKQKNIISILRDDQKDLFEIPNKNLQRIADFLKFRKYSRTE